VLGWLSLTSLGIGAVIGREFSRVGTAIAGQKLQVSSILNLPFCISDYIPLFRTAGAGPRLRFPYFGGGGVRFASVCYAELAAIIPIAGAHIVHIRDDGRVDRVDHRMGFDSGIRR